MRAGRSANLPRADFDQRGRGLTTMLPAAVAGPASAHGARTGIGGGDRHGAPCRRRFMQRVADA